MSKNKYKILSAFSAFALIVNALWPLHASAYSFSIPTLGEVDIDVQDIIDEADIDSEIESAQESLEDRYGFSQDFWRSAKRKANAPRVEIFFDNTNPKPGEKVTAHAVPEFFKNDIQNLYYTWYLIHTTNGKPQTATNSLADGKKESQAIIAHGDYDPDLDDQTYPNGSEDPDNDGWPSVDSNSYNNCLSSGSEADGTDCTFAPYGGADGVGGLGVGNENIEPYGSGNAYCSAQGSGSISACSLYTAKSSFNQYYNLQPDQSDYYCSECQQSLTFSSTLTEDNECCYLVANPGDPGLISYDPGTDYCPATYDIAYEACFDYDALQATNTNLINSCLSSEFAECVSNWDSIHYNPAGDEPVGSVSRCYKHNFGVNIGASGFRGFDGSDDSYAADASGTDTAVSCRHKWLDAPGYTSGSGRFSTGEEEYWKTDPTDPDTDGDGYFDEADVVGLGQDSFSWNYQPGDRLGVVVEGTSMIPVDEESAYYKIMWGYPDICDSSKTGLLDNDNCDGSSDYGYGFLATKSPNEQEPADQLKISLSYTPDDPIADPSAENNANISADGTIADADRITVTSSLDSTDHNPRNLHYKWQISKSTTLAEGSWKEVSNLNDNFNLSSSSSGLGLTSLSFTPKRSVLNEDAANIIYFKVTLTASTASEISANRGRASVVVPVNKNGIKIGIFKVDSSGQVAALGQEICTEGLYRIMCPAVQYQMLGARVTNGKYNLSNSDFSWSIDGNLYGIPPETQQYFAGLDDKTIFFPVMKGADETFTLSVSATPKDELAPVTGSRTLTVVEPAAFIESVDPSISWPFTYEAASQNEKGLIQTFASATNLEALTSSNAGYRLRFVPDYLLQNDPEVEIDWKLNGTSIHDVDFYETNPLGGEDATLSEDGGVFTFPTADEEGVYYTLSADVKKYWSEDDKYILGAAWGVAPETLDAHATISINTTTYQPLEDISSAGPRQILAAIGTHLPHYFMYNLRLALTIIVMFFASAGLHSLSQRFKLQ